MSPRNEYLTRLDARRKTLERLRRQDEQVANFRTAVACIGILLLWIVFGGWGVPWQFLLLPLGVFIAAVVYHETIKRKLRVVKLAIDYYQRCLNRLAGEWAHIGPAGEEFVDPQHPCSGDLDLFGDGSLFQLLNSPVTPVGAKTLASWLAPGTNESLPARATVLDRQDAVRALRAETNLRERLAIIGPTTQSQQDALHLQQWLASPGGLTAPGIRIVGLLLGLLGIAALGYFFTTNKLSPLLLVLAFQLGFLYRIREPLLAIKKHSEQAVFELRRIVQVLSALETVAGEDQGISRLRNELHEGPIRVSDIIHQLERQVSQFENSRRNVVIAPLALLSMRGLFYARSIDLWRTQYGPHVPRWFDAIGELEALLAFSQLHFENPGYCFPNLTKQPPQFLAQGLSHPLLPADVAVGNDVALGDDCRLLLVSGSNMSGKSTLLRSVGINSVLAWAGAPVCAQELTLSRLRVAAAMRMQDSLQEGTSHFFAELKRIQLVVELTEKETEDSETVLFLLDEILHGTNSHDRLVGARGVIESLLTAGAMGLVTTHDLALSDMVSEIDAAARNVHFRDEWIDGKMTFDYQMRDGVVPKSNALSLMRLLGLDV